MFVREGRDGERERGERGEREREREERERERVLVVAFSDLCLSVYYMYRRS